ncbi:hypothetical protein KY334_04280 [Candidatus Woesearchaeota archaeon]|nr:hypothetical protein [Candidatus Woesearchaeota archaeon]
MKDLEKRMYFCVPYNISPIQQAIQAGHAALEYAHKYKDNEEYIDFIENWKTWIILNGGTTNSKLDENANNYLGTLNQLESSIIQFNFEVKRTKDENQEINFSTFWEPDLNDALTAVCFVCDERVFNYTDYPDIDIFIKEGDGAYNKNLWFETFKNGPWTLENAEEQFPSLYKEWEEFLGGPKNVFLRYLLKNKKLA